MPRIAIIGLLLTIALVNSAPLDQSALPVNKGDQSKAAIEQKDTAKSAEKSNEATTPKPDTDAKDGSAAKTSDKSTAAQNSEPFEPSNIAMYVFETGNIEGVEKALKSLVESKKITAEQAAQLHESILRQVEQMSAAALTALLEQQRQAEAQATLQEMAEITEQMLSQAELRERLYDRIAELYGKQTIMNDDQSAEALQTYIVALGESSAKGDLNEGVKEDLVEVIDAALRDVKTAAETTEQEDEVAQLRKLESAQ